MDLARALFAAIIIMFFATAAGVGAAVLLAILNASPALSQQQQPQCGPADAIERSLSGQYKESPRWLGRLSQGGVNFILTMSPDGETWTVYWRRNDGMACLLAAGVKGEFIDGPAQPTF